MSQSFNVWQPLTVYCYESNADCKRCPIATMKLSQLAPENCQMPQAVQAALAKYGPPPKLNPLVDGQRYRKAGST